MTGGWCRAQDVVVGALSSCFLLLLPLQRFHGVSLVRFSPAFSMRVVLGRIMSCRPLGPRHLNTTTAAATAATATATATAATSPATTHAGWKWKPPESGLGRPLDSPGGSVSSVLPEVPPREYDEQTVVAEPVDRQQHDEDLRATFYGILRNAQPEQTMNVLLDPRFAEYVASMPQSTFVEALHLLSPVYFADPYREIHRPLHPTTVRAKGYRSLESIFDDFAEKLATIVQLRQSAGHVLGLAEYAHLLDCARAIGDAAMADMVWENMHEDGVSPDVQCYNHYMGAKVWDGAHTGREKYHLRVTPFAYRKRRFVQPNQGWQGYGTAGRSVRKEVLRILNEMSEAGYHGDETTFVNILLACGRVGHVKGIKKVLMAAWNIDIDTLLSESDDSNIPPVRAYDPSSPLHPTERLLLALAHVLGTNNDISAALRAIDFVANAYNLPISGNVWRELFERTFVLSRPRFGSDAKRNSKGKVSYDFLTFMYKTMTAAPYHVRPTIEMYHILAKTAWDRDRLSAFQGYMCAAYEILSETRQKRNKARSVVQGYLRALKTSPDNQQTSQILHSRALAYALNTYDLLRLRTAQQTAIMERFARLLVINHRWTGRDNPVWERVLLPRAIEEWRDFLPTSFVYPTRGGIVQFRGDSRWGQPFLKSHGKVPVRRTGGDGHGQGRREVEDDFVWEQWRRDLSGLDFDSPPLSRLFAGSCGVSLEFGDGDGDVDAASSE